jgi:hypothetical protein
VRLSSATALASFLLFSLVVGMDSEMVPVPISEMGTGTISGVAWAQDSGSVIERGPVRTEILLDPIAPRIGDPVTLSIKVSAEAGVEVYMPEFGQALERFAVLDFKPRQSIDDEGRNVYEQSYSLEVARSGPNAVPPIMIEFVDRRPGEKPAPEGADAYEILTERLSFTVESVLPDDAEADLVRARDFIEPNRDPKRIWWGLIALSVALAIAAILALPAWRRWREEARRQSAFDLAINRLAALRRQSRDDAEQIDAFFVELSALIRRYVEDRFHLRAPELTTEEFLGAATASTELTDDHRQFLRDFLNTADMVKFAQLLPDAEDIERGLSAAARFLEQTRDELTSNNKGDA